jgi:hypothetical protein
MNNKIVFTHDVPEERAWINHHFKNYKNLETYSSGNWNTGFPVQTHQCHLYEIAYSDYQDPRKLLHFDGEKIKSCYSTDPELVIRDNKYWTCADDFISLDLPAVFRDQPKFWVAHIARSGTVFSEILLSQFRTKFRGHVGISSQHNDLIGIWDTAQKNPDVTLVFLYRPELWETFTSTFLATKYGFHHEDHFDWSIAEPVEISINNMLQFEYTLTSTLNFWCNLRMLLSQQSFMLLNGTELIQKYSKLVSHQKVNYNKQDLISNYSAAKKIWYDQFDPDLGKMLKNALTHLTKMNCKTNIDHLL